MRVDVVSFGSMVGKEALVLFVFNISTHDA